jgi:hypothetical protein
LPNPQWLTLSITIEQERILNISAGNLSAEVSGEDLGAAMTAMNGRELKCY